MYVPLPDTLTIKQSAIHGLGLFAAADIVAGVVLGVSHVADDRFENSHIRTPLGGFYNHSENPNCCTVKDGDLVYLKTIRDIKTGEEITSHYVLYTPL
jgi:SET domain-containing protein